MFENVDLGNVLAIVFGLGTTVFSAAWAVAKGKLGQVKTVAKEGYEAIKTLVEAFDDDKVDKTELAAIKKEGLEAWDAIKTLLGLNKK